MNLNTLLVLVLSLTILRGNAQKKGLFKPQKVYSSEGLMVLQIAKNAFQHISYKQTNDFGNVACNGLVVKNNNEAIVFDTPTNDKSAAELIKWVTETLQCKIKAIIPTHFHDDCLGGLGAFDASNIPSYAYFRTTELAKENNFVVPKNSFRDSLVLKVGSEIVVAKFFGEGHTKDNVVGYFPHENILFGGCLVKELKASKGYLGDANTADWSSTVAKIKRHYPNLKLVVPGHGEHGTPKLLDYTIDLFKTQYFGEKKLNKAN